MYKRENKLIWKPARNGIFSVKSVQETVNVAGNTYDAGSTYDASDGPVNFPWNQLWNAELPPKILSFL